jgi:hypothetical protein
MTTAITPHRAMPITPLAELAQSLVDTGRCDPTSVAALPTAGAFSTAIQPDHLSDIREESTNESSGGDSRVTRPCVLHVGKNFAVAIAAVLSQPRDNDRLRKRMRDQALPRETQRMVTASGECLIQLIEQRRQLLST